MHYRYHALGLDLTTAFPCPGLTAGDGQTAGRPVEIMLGPVPAALDAPITKLPLVEIDAQGRCLHQVPGVARYLVAGRGHIVIELAAGASVERALRFLRGVPLAVACCQWDLVPLSLACVALGERALLIGGGPASGKSSVVAALLGQGGRLMADGLCALDAAAPTQPQIWPGFAELGLWRDSLKALDWPVPVAAPGPGGRYRLEASSWFEPRPLPAAALIQINAAPDGAAEEMLPRPARHGFTVIMNAAGILDLTRRLPGAQMGLTAVARLASTVPVFEFRRRAGFDDLGGRILAGLGHMSCNSICKG